MNKLKRFIRDNRMLLFVLAAIYRFFGVNRIKGKRTLKVSWKGVFAYHMNVVNCGHRNKLEIEEGCRLKNTTIRFYGNNNFVKIENDCVANELEVYVQDDSNTVSIGHNTHFTGKAHLACIEGCELSIGSRCLLSSEVTFRTGDSHSILDKEGKRINYSSSISVGDHVWIGNKVIVLKGTKISDETIVGTGSIVTGKEFEGNSVIVGTPAKIIKHDVSWHHENLK
ncbi:galactoside O-acetyltransferase [Clostridium ragsdalei P11]|uniref:Galactoside O-acetyltransferase n=1 Tax=Clostridium ragsdalei P11 TaxID=1353534 RepID=A0A1A6AIK2_9CLOT|nr:acyltransferase [Clostridium ragsdalei]OBR89887.1 galactoside O-acetyltransferase [Clostridium ragsdalei P11]